MQNLAAVMQRHKGFGHLVSLHQRIGTMDQQQVETIGMDMPQ